MAKEHRHKVRGATSPAEAREEDTESNEVAEVVRNTLDVQQEATVEVTDGVTDEATVVVTDGELGAEIA